MNGSGCDRKAFQRQPGRLILFCFVVVCLLFAISLFTILLITFGSSCCAGGSLGSAGWELLPRYPGVTLQHLDPGTSPPGHVPTHTSHQHHTVGELP